MILRIDRILQSTDEKDDVMTSLHVIYSSFQALHSILFAVYIYKSNWFTITQNVWHPGLTNHARCLTARRSKSTWKWLSARRPQSNKMSDFQTGPIEQNVLGPDGSVCLNNKVFIIHQRCVLLRSLVCQIT